jgi:hypothetical protein
MTLANGFMPLRRGVFEHVRDGRMCPTDFTCFAYMSMSPRTSRSVIERLEKRGYIKRFPVPGRHACYPILVHKYQVTTGEHFGEQLNALDATSPTDLRYFPREHDGEEDARHDDEQVATQKRIKNKERRIKKNLAAKTAPLGDPRFKPFYDFAHEAFRAKFG